MSWDTMTWKDIVDIRNGKSQKEVMSDDGKYPIIGSSGKPIGYAKEYLCEANSTIIGRKGTINNPILIEYNYWNVDTAFGLHSKKGLHFKFLYYFCKSFDFTKLDKGSGRPSLVKSDLLKIKMPVPEISEQKQIVETLDKAFEKIDKAIANIERNIENAEELFQSKLSQIFSETDGGFEMTWEDVVDIRNGKSQKEVMSDDGKYPIIGSSGKPIGYAKEYLCEANSTIIGRKGTINNPILIENNYWNVDTAFGLHSKDGLHYKFLFYFCKSFDFTKLDKGSGRPSLVKSDLLKIKMPVPKTIEQKEIVETLDNLNNNVKAIISVYKKELINLEELKKSILEKAFKGELTSAA